jgi:hypothetical protein
MVYVAMINTCGAMMHFSQAWAARQPDLDRVFAETIRIVPMRAGGYAACMPDPDRAAQQIPAIITERPGRAHTVENSIGRDFDRALMTADLIASIDQARLGAEWPKLGDLVIAVNRPDAPSFEIAAVESDGLARVLLSLVRMP